MSYYLGDWTVIVPAPRLLEVAQHLRDAAGAQFDYCSDVTAVDWPTREGDRFDVVYCLYSTRLRHRVRVKARVADGVAVPSVSGVWAAANWLEREVCDMFGIRFDGPPGPAADPDARRVAGASRSGRTTRWRGRASWILESPQDWLKLRQSFNEAEIE